MPKPAFSTFTAQKKVHKNHTVNYMYDQTTLKKVQFLPHKTRLYTDILLKKIIIKKVFVKTYNLFIFSWFDLSEGLFK